MKIQRGSKQVFHSFYQAPPKGRKPKNQNIYKDPFNQEAFKIKQANEKIAKLQIARQSLRDLQYIIQGIEKGDISKLKALSFELQSFQKTHSLALSKNISYENLNNISQALKHKEREIMQEQEKLLNEFNVWFASVEDVEFDRLKLQDSEFSVAHQPTQSSVYALMI